VPELTRRPVLPANTRVPLTEQGREWMRACGRPVAEVRVLRLEFRTDCSLPGGTHEDVYLVEAAGGEPLLLGTGWMLWPEVG
jgi:hypothetical protein